MGSSPIRVAIGKSLRIEPRSGADEQFDFFMPRCGLPHPVFIASVAQLVEQGTENPCVSGSIPL